MRVGKRLSYFVPYHTLQGGSIELSWPAAVISTGALFHTPAAIVPLRCPNWLAMPVGMATSLEGFTTDTASEEMLQSIYQLRVA
jgi:hypothetical protein